MFAYSSRDRNLSFLAAAKCLKRWWPGTELNRRRQPFQGCSHPKLSVDSARHSSEDLPDFILFTQAKMEPSRTNLSLPRFASNRHGSELAIHKVRFQRTGFDN